jgi:membrane protein DedA with SNARE-associated domain
MYNAQMFTDLIAYLAEVVIHIISSLGYFGVFLAMTIESACIPLPSEIIMPFAGFLVFKGQMNFVLAVLIGTVGNLAGSLIVYWVGMKGGRPLIEKYGKYILLSHHDLDLADSWFAKYGRSTVFFTRMLPVVRTFISFPAGVAKVPMKIFIPYTFLGALIWSVFLTFVGVKMGANWHTLSEYFHKADLLIAIIIVVGIVWYVWRHFKRRNRKL